MFCINLEENIGIGGLEFKREQRKNNKKEHLLTQLNTVLKRCQLMMNAFHIMAKAGLRFTTGSRIVHWLRKAVKHRTTL